MNRYEAADREADIVVEMLPAPDGVQLAGVRATCSQRTPHVVEIYLTTHDWGLSSPSRSSISEATDHGSRDAATADAITTVSSQTRAVVQPATPPPTVHPAASTLGAAVPTLQHVSDQM